MATLLNLQRMRNEPDFIPLLAAAGIDDRLMNQADKRADTVRILKYYNDVMVEGGKLPALNEEGLFQYIVDRQAAGFLEDLYLQLDAGEELPAAIEREAAPTIHRSGTAIIMESPVVNVPDGAATTTVVVYVDLVQRVKANRNLTLLNQRTVDISSWGLTGDESIQVGLEVGGVAGWLATLTLNNS